MSQVENFSFGDIPNDEASRDRIRKAVDEMVDSLTREQAEKDLRKSITDALKEEVKIKPELVNKFARWKYAGTAERDVTKVVDEKEAYEVLILKKEIQQTQG